jgi:NADH:ubiquinone oxidoreductase subunit K
MIEFSLNSINILILGIVGLFGVSLYGLLVTRNLIKIVAVLQVLVKAAVIALVLAGKVSGKPVLGGSLAATVIVADTVVAVIGLALAVQIQRRFGTVDTAQISTLKG